MDTLSLLTEIEAFLERTGMSQSSFGKRAAGSYSLVTRLRTGSEGPKPDTVAKIREFIAAREGRAIEAVAAPTDRPTGQQLYDEIMAYVAAGNGLTAIGFAVLLGRSGTALANIAKANFPKPETVKRVRAIIAGDRTPFVAAYGSPERRAASMNAVVNHDVADLRTRTNKAAEKRRPGETLADAVRREAEEQGKRRCNARESKGVRIIETNRERFARLAAEVEREERQADAIERSRQRERELDELVSPSSVLRRAQRDWPDQCTRVKAIAAELGVSLGEAWRRVIGAGVDCMTESEA